MGVIPCLIATRSAATTAAVRVTFAVVPATSVMIASTTANSAARNRGVNGTESAAMRRPLGARHVKQRA